MDKRESLRRHSLVNSKEWQEIKALLYDEIKDKSNSNISPEKLQGMLIAIGIVDSWEQTYQRYLKQEE